MAVMQCRRCDLGDRNYIRKDGDGNVDDDHRDQTMTATSNYNNCTATMDMVIAMLVTVDVCNPPQ